MLAPALRRNRGDRAFHDLQKRLLHAFARHVAGDRRVVGLARDLVDLVDIDDAALRALDIVLRRLKELQDDVLDVFAHVTGFGQRRGVGHGEGYIEDARQRLRQQRLAAAGGADQQDIRFRQFNVGLAGVVQALVVVVHGDGEHALGMHLADHVLVEHIADLARGRHAVGRFQTGGLGFFPDDVHAQFDTFVTDEDGRTCDQFADFVLTFAAEGTVECVLAVAGIVRHHTLPFQKGFSRSHVPLTETLKASGTGYNAKLTF